MRAADVRPGLRRVTRAFAFARWLTAAVLAACLGSPLAVASSAASPSLRVRFVPLTHGVTWHALAAGGVGRGLVLYYVQGRPATRPSLAVVLSRGSPSAVPEAQVYQAPPGLTYVPVLPTAHEGLTLAPGLQPSIVMRAVGGAWVRDGHPLYDLDVRIFGPIQAMWGSGPASGSKSGYVGLLSPHELAYVIEIRAAPDGQPWWDWRTLVPSFPGRGYYRTNYTQRECFGTARWMPSPSPLWPFVAFGGALSGGLFVQPPGVVLPRSGSFLQPPGEVVPPIVVDWSTGRIELFSEVVPLRAERCSYDFYSLVRILPGQANQPDFESPWGLYDLSGEGHGYPNLIIRTEHYNPDDFWATGADPSLLLTAPLDPDPIEDIRYSWADHPGNGTFNYKVDVFGTHPYPAYQTIAGGQVRVLAPAYRTYPTWVVQHRWPITTFVDAGPAGYPSSEGIYPWAAWSVGAAYWRGWTNEPDLKGLGPLPEGLRGEYRVGLVHRPWLYASPVDGRLHLLDAQGGLWNLGGGQELLEVNLTGGPYIDGWMLLDASRRGWLPGDQVPSVRRSEESLFELDGYLIYGGPQGVVVRRDARPSSVARLLPPADHASWLAFVHEARAFERGKDPRDLYTWTQGAGTRGLFVAQARLVRVMPEADGFALEVSVPGKATVRGRLPGLQVLAGGLQVWRYRGGIGTWVVQPAVGPSLRGAISVQGRPTALQGTVVRVSVADEGTVAWAGRVSVIDGGRPVTPALSVTVEPGYSKTFAVPWSPSRGGEQHLSVVAGPMTLASTSVYVEPARRPPWGVLAEGDAWGSWPTAFGLTLVVATVGIGGGLVLGVDLRRHGPYGRRR